MNSQWKKEMEQTLARIEKKVDLLMQFAEVVMEIMKSRMNTQYSEEINEEE